MTKPPPLRTEEIARIRKRFTAAGAADRTDDLWMSMIDRPIGSPRALKDYHDLLLFLLAFPRSKADHARATHDLDRVAEIAAVMYEQSDSCQRSLENSGIAGTTICAHFSKLLLQWLVLSQDAAVTLDSFEGEEDVVRAMLQDLSLPAEREAMDDPGYGVMDRIRTASGNRSLPWLLDALDGSGASNTLYHTIWTAIRPYVTIPCERSAVSRTYCRGVKHPLHSWSKGIRPDVPTERILQQPIGEPRTLDSDERDRLVAAVRGILVGHLRETDTATFCDPKAIEYFDLGSGVGIALLTLPPGRRTLFDSYIGYVAFSNAVPVAYGGAWIFPGKSKVGINVFPAFRGGPSSFLFAQILRCYVQRFGVECFEADSYQLGHGNPDGIRSGVFWFYHRLGFRTTDADLEMMQDREEELRQRDAKHRTGPAILRKLASLPMRLKLTLGPIIDLEPIDLSEAVLQHLGGIGDGDRGVAERRCLNKVKKELGVGKMSGWTTEERCAFTDLAPSLAFIPDLHKWSRRDKARIISALRSKGHTKEDRYINALRSHPEMLQAWTGFVKRSVT
ncbi:MAG: hypothetical protein IPP83_19370 [Flavobacteriales bacterium]|nr:hypothetical protein [Flavobacteriales bacterium]